MLRDGIERVINDLNNDLDKMGLNNIFQFFLITNGANNIIKLEGVSILNFSMTLYSDDMVLNNSIENLYEEGKIFYIEVVREQVWRSFEEIIYYLRRLN